MNELIGDAQALKTAIELLHIPSQVRVMRSAPLPKGTPLLLRLAAGEPDAAREAERLTRHSSEQSERAAAFFIEQILLASDSDNYRILGLDHTATDAELRAHMALLLKWLHPDLNADNHKSILARRVIAAWEQLKTPDRRRSHDARYQTPREKRKSGPSKTRKTKASPKPVSYGRPKLRSFFGIFFRFPRAGREH